MGETYYNGGRDIGIGGALAQAPATFQLLPHLTQQTDSLAKCIATTSEILRRLRGNLPTPDTNKVAKGPETASDFALTHNDQIRFLANNIQEIASLIG